MSLILKLLIPLALIPILPLQALAQDSTASGQQAQDDQITSAPSQSFPNIPLPFIIAGVVLLILIVIGAYFFNKNRQSNPKPPAQTPPNQPTPPKATNTPKDDAPAPKSNTHDSQELVQKAQASLETWEKEVKKH